MLSEAKHLLAHPERPFAEFTLERSEGLRVTNYLPTLNGKNHQDVNGWFLPFLNLIAKDHQAADGRFLPLPDLVANNHYDGERDSFVSSGESSGHRDKHKAPSHSHIHPLSLQVLLAAPRPVGTGGGEERLRGPCACPRRGS
jgi:hypothetical protein